MKGIKPPRRFGRPSGKKWDKTIKSLVKKSLAEVIKEKNIFFIKHIM